MKQCNINYINIINLINEIRYIPLLIDGEELIIITKEYKTKFIHLKKPIHESYKNKPFFNWINNY